VLQPLSAAKLQASRVICVLADVSISDVKQSRQSKSIMDVILSMKIVLKLNKIGSGRIHEALRRLCLTIVAVRKQEIVHILSVCSRSYPACKTDVPFCIVTCGLSDSTIFFHIIS
jgi:hypothetical protein